MSNSARDRIAERVKNAYAAGYNDGRKGRDRMDEVAETETAKILEVVREALLSEYTVEAFTASLGNEIEERHHPRWLYDVACGVVETAWQDAFGADDDGGER